METLEELVAQRRGYKFLDKDGKSPYQKFVYDLKNKNPMITKIDTNLHEDCGEGWNLATLEWIGNNCLKLEGIIIECSIPDSAVIIVPNKSDGKFRTDIIKIKKVHEIESLFPTLKNLGTRLKNYKPINPITAETMPPRSKIKKYMDQVGAQVRDQVGAQVWDQVGAQVWDQVYICGYYAIKEFFNLDYDHPAFQLVKLGIIVVRVLNKFKVFGKNGKFLGEFEQKGESQCYRLILR